MRGAVAAFRRNPATFSEDPLIRESEISMVVASPGAPHRRAAIERTSPVKASSLFQIPTLPEPGSVIRLAGAHGCARSLAAVSIAERHAGPVMMVVPDLLSAERVRAELEVFADALPVMMLPDWETLPYDHFSPYQDIISERLTVLAALPQMTSGILVVALPTLMQRLGERRWLLGNSVQLKVGQTLDRDAFVSQLIEGGYQSVSQVAEHGEFAIRGAILDLFPMGQAAPLRIELFDDEIEALKQFDPETQRTTEQVDAVAILPARELPLTQRDRSAFQRRWFARFPDSDSGVAMLDDVMNGLTPGGIEYYLPLFFDTTETLFDFLPDTTLLIDVEHALGRAADVFAHIEERHAALGHDISRPILAPAEIALEPDALHARIAGYGVVALAGLDPKAGSQGLNTRAPLKISIDARAAEPLAPVRRHLETFPGRVLFVVDSKGRRETVTELFRDHGIRLQQVESFSAFLAGKSSPALLVAVLESGTELNDPAISIVAESQLFGDRAAQKRRRRRTRTDSEAVIRNLVELDAGAPVVHEAHGVGRYCGLTKLTLSGVENEFIELEYADGDKLYVPVSDLHLLSRYAGIDADKAPLHKLGSGQWEKARSRAAQKVRDVAAELLEIYAQREARQGFAYEVQPEAVRAFAEGFPFEETPDQESAIEAVTADLASPRPMDRLICGDAGFGKTEVAMRAAFVAVNGGKQVAVLVPTTLLSQQHYQTFSDRFADWPVRVENLSRFRTGAETTRVLKGLADGTVDIVVGTHKLLGSSVEFQRLGLLIIDEEHRFGVRQKEKIRALRADVDMLTLTATPIPRTLNMALSGTRDISIIATPPSRRQAVQTFVREWRDELVAEAIYREIARGGQVFFLHNEVEGIEDVARQIEALVPEARVKIGHGQMREKDLEQIMLDFYHRRFNVLVCTTIIENGIDVPTANTIIINRADRFGLAQLYQLRGRVGRSHHRAYAYLIVPHVKSMTADAVKRLEAIESLQELGVGFTLATHDLEIRGAGEILGDDQSGHVQEIGFGLYSELLTRAVEALKSGKEPSLDRPLTEAGEVDLNVPALFPDDYLPDVRNRLILYKRVAGARDLEELAGLKEEVIDRFGDLPTPASNLFRLAQLKLRVLPLGISKIDLGRGGGRITFSEDVAIDPGRLITYVQRRDPEYRFDGPEKIRVRKALPEPQMRFDEVEQFIEAVGERRAA